MKSAERYTDLCDSETETLPLVHPIREKTPSELHHIPSYLGLVLTTWFTSRALAHFYAWPVPVSRDPLHWGHSLLVTVVGAVVVFYLGRVHRRVGCQDTRPRFYLAMFVASLVSSALQGPRAVTLSADGFAGRSWFAFSVFLGTWLFLLGFVLPEHVRLASRRGLHYAVQWLLYVLFLPAVFILILDFSISKSLSIPPLSRLHVHHYTWASVLAAGCRFRESLSALTQAGLIGLALQGLGVWGVDSFWPLVNK